ncbi:RagB/SusD family nutrient uptake outer membrane protein [Mucilaginibacter paludis]|uniref:RagB/SusD domain-containing protein n=1 Tax=Mucilaginibacter paludis DSM 18603 TaxID=714943 RepID=H1Y6N4_9SPHI|nr:RagB/SusD family nutrient uptake outer membrane protein [Mucilaginibacter paludis]EHQ26826.1 RagB/SusD domain-containing protein [Mucilaginibacter paludis DSM 18603]
MRKTLITILTCAGLLLNTSCKKFLNTTPTDFLSPVNYYQTDDQINTALTGIYDILGKTGTYGRYLFFEMDVADDAFVALPSWTQDVGLYNYDPSDTKINTCWALLYQGINLSNLVLENIDKSALTQANKNVAKGQALFLRAYFYFILTSNWGDVPLRLASTKSVNENNVPRTPYKVVYQQIVADMEQAADLVNPITAYTYNSRITKSVVWGILARVNLKMAGAPLRDASRFAEAKKWAGKVMTDAPHALNPDYKQVFKNMCQHIYDTKESIWEVEFSIKNGTQDEGGSVGVINGIGTSNATVGYSYGAKHATQRYYNLFGTNDLRRDWSIGPYTYTSSTSSVLIYYTAAQIYNRCDAKWRREFESSTVKFTNTSAINFPLLRYADVLLMYAEAENEVNGATSLAYNAINLVRERAYGVGLGLSTATAADLTAGMDKDTFREAVRKERALELGYEGLRRFDLIRWGIFVSTMKSIGNEITTTAPSGYTYGGVSGNNVSNRDTLFAIPSKETSLNSSIVQNKGW